MITPSHSSLRVACEREVLSVPSEPLQLLLPGCDDSTDRTTPISAFVDGVLSLTTTNMIGLTNPGAAYLDLHYIIPDSDSPPVGARPSFYLWGAKKIPDKGDAKYAPGFDISATGTKGYVIVPLFNPDTGDRLVDFNTADPEINETVGSNTIAQYSNDQKVYCRGCDIIFATFVSDDTDYAGTLMGQFVN